MTPRLLCTSVSAHAFQDSAKDLTSLSWLLLPDWDSWPARLPSFFRVMSFVTVITFHFNSASPPLSPLSDVTTNTKICVNSEKHKFTNLSQQTAVMAAGRCLGLHRRRPCDFQTGFCTIHIVRSTKDADILPHSTKMTTWTPSQVSAGSSSQGTASHSIVSHLIFGHNW